MGDPAYPPILDRIKVNGGETLLMIRKRRIGGGHGKAKIVPVQENQAPVARINHTFRTARGNFFFGGAQHKNRCSRDIVE